MPRAYAHDPIKARIYNTYRNIRQICFNENNKLHKIYTQNGVDLACDWNSFREFYDWVLEHLGPPPGPEYNIIRKNMMKGWTRRNMEWNTKQVQQSRQRRAVICTYQGQRRCIADWSRELNMSMFTIYQRRYRGEHKASRLLHQGKLDAKK